MLARAEGYVLYRGEWWRIVHELPRDMYALELDGRMRHVSLRVLLGAAQEDAE